MLIQAVETYLAVRRAADFKLDAVARYLRSFAQFAAAAGVNQRYLREWASHQAASKYLTYDATTQKFSLTDE